MKMRRFLGDFLSFTRGERIGLTFLIGLIVLMAVANKVIFYFEKPVIANRAKFDRMVAEARQAEEAENRSLHLFDFDPNTVDSATLSMLQLPGHVKRNLLNYRRHGGKFRKPADFRRIYGMNDSVYTVIKDYIRIIPSGSHPELWVSNGERVEAADRNHPSSGIGDGSRAEAEPPESRDLVLDVNMASAEEFVKLNGIGEVLSKRIVKYRDALGGFARVDQLGEVYGLAPEIFQQIRSNLLCDSLVVTKLDLNYATVDELAKHPYINYKEARKIVDFRSKNGYISNSYFLLEDSVLTENVYRKVAVYLK